MSDKTGDYTFEVTATLEAGEAVKKKFDIVAFSDCNGIKSAPVKTTVSVLLGSANQSGEKKQSVSFHYEKQKYPLVLQASQAICAGDRVIIDIKTTAVELKAGDKLIPLPGAGGTLRNTRYEIPFTDKACFPENEIVLTATDEAADPTTRDLRVTWTCPLQNTEKPELLITEQSKGFQIRVNDRSFNCDKAEEVVVVTVDANSQSGLAEFEVSRNGDGQLVPFVNGVNVTYTIKALDKGKNMALSTFVKDGYLDTKPTIRLIDPPSLNYTRYQKILPPNPPKVLDGEIEIPFTFRVEMSGADDYKLIKRVEFRPSVGVNHFYEGSNMPTDLQFDDITLTYLLRDFQNRSSSKTFNYIIRVITITDEVVEKSGTLTVQDR